MHGAPMRPMSSLPTLHLHLRRARSTDTKFNVNKALTTMTDAVPLVLQSKLGQLPSLSALVRVHHVQDIFEDTPRLIGHGKLDTGAAVFHLRAHEPPPTCLTSSGIEAKGQARLNPPQITCCFAQHLPGLAQTQCTTKEVVGVQVNAASESRILIYTYYEIQANH